MLSGTWVAFDEETNSWKRFEFTEKREFTYWGSPDLKDFNQMRFSFGSYYWSLSDGTVTVNCKIGDDVSGQLTDITFTLSDWSENHIDCSVAEGNTLTDNVTFIRVVESFFEAPQTSVKPDKDKFKGFNLEDMVSLSASVVTVDKNTESLRLTGSGTAYVKVPSETEYAYLEVISSPFLEIPYPFEKYIGSDEEYYGGGNRPSLSSPGVPGTGGFTVHIDDGSLPVLSGFTGKEGISEITTTRAETTTSSWVDGVIVSFSEEVCPLAIWTVLNNRYTFDRYWGSSFDFEITDNEGKWSAWSYWVNWTVSDRLIRYYYKVK